MFKRDHVPPGFRSASLLALLAAGLIAASPAPSGQPTIVIRERGMDRDKDGFYEGLGVEVEAKGCRPQHTYGIDSRVIVPEIGLTDWSGPLGMSVREFGAQLKGIPWDDSVQWASASRAGVARFKFILDGEDLCALRRDGPWTLDIGIWDDTDPEMIDGHATEDGSEFKIQSRAWRWRQFGTHSVYGESVRWFVEPDSTTIGLRVSVFCHRADTLRFAARAECGALSADTTVTQRVAPGSSTIDVLLPLKDSEGRRPSSAPIAQLKIRVLGPDFGGQGPPRWEFGHWPHSKLELWRWGKY